MKVWALEAGLVAVSAAIIVRAGDARAAVAQTLPGFTMQRTGAIDDFAYFEGPGWQTVQKRLRTDANGKESWNEFPGTLCMQRYLGGMVTVDELYFPTLKQAGFTLRTFDPAKRQWSIYWMSDQTGKLDPIPVVGGFSGSTGEFYAEDKLDGRPVKVRYLWKILDRDHARWEQALSFDDRTWKTNWTADFTRAKSSDVCASGKPVRR